MTDCRLRPLRREAAVPKAGEVFSAEKISPGNKRGVKMKLLFLNGVNLNMTGRREKGVYGTQTLDEINAEIAASRTERRKNGAGS